METSVETYAKSLFFKFALLKNENKTSYLALHTYTVKELCFIVLDELILYGCHQDSNFFNEVKIYIQKL
jgi:hypothetical protein